MSGPLRNTIRSLWTPEAPGASRESLRAIRHDKTVFLVGLFGVIFAVGIAVAGIAAPLAYTLWSHT